MLASMKTAKERQGVYRSFCLEGSTRGGGFRVGIPASGTNETEKSSQKVVTANWRRYPSAPTETARWMRRGVTLYLRLRRGKSSFQDTSNERDDDHLPVLCEGVQAHGVSCRSPYRANPPGI